MGSDDKIFVGLYDKDSGHVGNVVVKFSSTMMYWIFYCSDGATELPVQPPKEVDKIWTIAKTETAIVITCNDVEVLNYLFADSPRNKCVPGIDRNNEA